MCCVRPRVARGYARMECREAAHQHIYVLVLRTYALPDAAATVLMALAHCWEGGYMLLAHCTDDAAIVELEHIASNYADHHASVH